MSAFPTQMVIDFQMMTGYCCHLYCYCSQYSRDHPCMNFDCGNVLHTHTRTTKNSQFQDKCALYVYSCENKFVLKMP